MLPLLTIALLALQPAPEFPVEAGPPADVELYFEAKLLVRQRSWGRRIEVDQWAGGRLAMRAEKATDGAVRLELVEVVESPWTFRWYPTRDEAKLGAAIHVAQPSGDPYSSLAPILEPMARRKYDLWWDSDPASPGPSWSAETGGFWKQRHRKELDAKDPLPEHPTYPFHLLGPLPGRLGFTLRDGEVIGVRERLTSTWLSDGWARSCDGDPVQGYGYWEAQRPGWEPRTYETLVAALGLLASHEEGRTVDPVETLAGVLAALQPRAARVVRGWRAEDAAMKAAGETANGVIEARGSVARRNLDFRWWRMAGEDTYEVQILVDDRGAEALKFWVRVGYRPLDEGKLSGSPSTNERISSRTRR